MNYAQYLENYYNGNEQNIYSIIIQKVSINFHGNKLTVHYLYVLNLITYEVEYLNIYKQDVSEDQVNKLLETLHSKVMDKEPKAKLYLMTNSLFKPFISNSFLNLIDELYIHHHSYSGTTQFPIVEISRYYFTGLARMRLELNKFHSKDAQEWVKVWNEDCVPLNRKLVDLMIL